MAMGPGKYDDLCTYVREQSGGQGAIVIVIGGKRGNGFACQTDLATLQSLPEILRHMADEIDDQRPNSDKR